MNEALESTDISALRRVAVAAWQRAERLEAERSEALEAKADAVSAKKVVQAKYDAVATSIEQLQAGAAAEATPGMPFDPARDRRWSALVLEAVDPRPG